VGKGALFRAVPTIGVSVGTAHLIPHRLLEPVTAHD
jgi:hypothetical protein